MHRARKIWLGALLEVLILSLAAHAASGSDVCPDICGQLPEKQRQAAGLAVSMVALTSCEGDIEGAARAVATAAADGDLSAFGAGLSVGAAVLAGPDENGRGQMAQIIQETLTVADSQNKTVGVASALGNALAAMSGSTAESVANQTVQALNDLATDVSCSAAASSAATLFFSTKHANPGLAAFFLNSAVKHGNVCWVRRLRRLTTSPVFNLPPPSSPCTRRMQAASTVSVSLITASACRSDKATPVAAAAYALATAAVKDGCSFASAVAASQMQGLPKEAVQDVYRAAITKAGSSNTQQQLSNGFVSALTQINDVNSGQELLDNLLAAVEGTIKASGCTAAEKFSQGLYAKLASLDPSNRATVQAAFAARPYVAACKYSYSA